jgi:hypothetical protein
VQRRNTDSVQQALSKLDNVESCLTDEYLGLRAGLVPASLRRERFISNLERHLCARVLIENILAELFFGLTVVAKQKVNSFKPLGLSGIRLADDDIHTLFEGERLLCAVSSQATGRYDSKTLRTHKIGSPSLRSTTSLLNTP